MKKDDDRWETLDAELVFRTVSEHMGADFGFILSKPTAAISETARAENCGQALKICLGRDSAGDAFWVPLCDLPHLMVAGMSEKQTRQGIHNILSSVLMTAGPDTVRLVMLDCRKDALTRYNGIVHLIHPVVTALDEGVAALEWISRELTRRKMLLDAEKCADRAAYNAMARSSKASGKDETDGFTKQEVLPAILVCIHELADLMQAFSMETEFALARIGQMGRVCGIHIVAATNKVTIDVMTGLLKANIPGRLAFRTASAVESMIILDTTGAENLTDRGEALFMGDDTLWPIPVCCPDIAGKDLAALAAFWKKAGPARQV